MPLPSTFGQDPRRGLLGLILLRGLMQAHQGTNQVPSTAPSTANPFSATGGGPGPAGPSVFSSLARLLGGQGLKQAGASLASGLAAPAPGALTLSLGGAAPSGSAEIAAALGAEGLGDVGAGGAVTSLGTLAGALAFPLIAGNIVGSITGRGIFGGKNPRDAQRKAAEVNRNVSAAFPALRSDLQIAATQGDVQQAIDNFTFRVADTGFGLGFAEGHGAGLPKAGLLPNPPGGQFDSLVAQFQPMINRLLQTLPPDQLVPRPTPSNASPFQQRRALRPDRPQQLSDPRRRVADYGAAIRAERANANQTQQNAILGNIFSRTGIPAGTVNQVLALGGSISGADTADPVVWSERGRVFAPGFGEGGG